MNRMRGWIVGLTIVALLGVGIAAIAGNGFGQGATRASRQGTNGDAAACSGDCVQAQDGAGSGTCAGYGQHLSATRPLDGSGYHGGQTAGPRNGQRSGQGACATEQRSCAGNCS